MIKYFSLIVLCILSLSSFCQLEDGTIAPDFTLTDWYGETHNLYSYLDENKTVFLEVFATHCPGCWAYHQTERLKNMYLEYGPEGTDEVMVLALEHDEYNGVNGWTGIGDPWTTQGNWLEGTPYPQFNVEWPDRGVFDDYNVTFYPVVYKICPNRELERVSTNWNEETLYELVQACEPLSIEDTESDEFVFHHDVSKKTLSVFSNSNNNVLRILNIQGQIVKEYFHEVESVIDISFLNSGVYILKLESDEILTSSRIIVE